MTSRKNASHKLKVYGSLISVALSSIIIPFGVTLYTYQIVKPGGDYFNISLIPIIIGLFLLIIGSIKNYKRTKSYESNLKALGQKKEELDKKESQNQDMYEKLFTSLYEILRTYLAYVEENELNGIITSTERITVYAHDKQKKGFRQIGRYSPDATYNKRSSNRKFYPENQGSIGEAWAKGECEITVPDPKKDPKRYKDVLMNKYEFPEDIAENISMKSCLFIGYAIKDGRKNSIGVLLFESTNLNKLKTKKSKLKEIALDKHKVLQTVVEKELELRELFPFHKQLN